MIRTCKKCKKVFEVFNRNQSRICSACRKFGYKPRSVYGLSKPIYEKQIYTENKPFFPKIREGKFMEYVRLVNPKLAEKLLL